MTIRYAKISDLDVIVNIYNQAISNGKATADTELINISDKIDWFNSHTPEAYPIYVIEFNGETFGWASLSPYRKGRKGFKHVAEISYYLDYNLHGKGYAKLLLEFVINDCKRLEIINLVAFLLDVNIKSQRFLESFGFNKWGHLPDIANLKDGVCGQFLYGKRINS